MNSFLARILFALVLLVTTVACGSSSGGGGSSSGTPAAAANSPAIEGTYLMSFTSSTTTGRLIYVLQLGPGNSVNAGEIYLPTSNSATGYTRKNKGTYTRNGDDYTFNYTYETCTPVGSESLRITATDPSDRIFLSKDATTLQMLNAAKYTIGGVDPNSIAAFIEDTSCDKIP